MLEAGMKGKIRKEMLEAEMKGKISKENFRRTREERGQMKQRTRKWMTVHKALHQRSDIDRMCKKKKKGESWLASIENCIDASIQRLEDYIKKKKKINYSSHL